MRRFLVFTVFAILAFPIASPIVAAERPATSAPLQAISDTLSMAMAKTSASGAAVLVGQDQAIAYVETIGDATLNTVQVVPAQADLAQLMLIMALIDTSFIGIDDEASRYLSVTTENTNATTVRALLSQRAQDNVGANEAAITLIQIAESATARQWETLFNEWIAEPLAVKNTRYTIANGISSALDTQGPTGEVETSVRDYMRILATLTNQGTFKTAEILSPDLANLSISLQMNKGTCTNTTNPACGILEIDAPGLYAWIDQPRSLYGVVTTPGAQKSLAFYGRSIRDNAIAMHDQTGLGEGLTSAIPATD